ncbi:uncharacterized protein [Arachis hypogaea]|nr:uncharacterized protein LOC112727095 [Arachis hypogaea]
MKLRYGLESPWFFTIVYGSPQIGLRTSLWEGLNIADNLTSEWCVGGDFNCVLSATDTGDLGFKGQPFTWQKGIIRRQLDRYVTNAAWSQRFSSAVVKHLPKLKSDHVLIFLELWVDSTAASSCRPFRFLASWLTHENFNSMLKTNSKDEISLDQNVTNFMEAAKVWNKEVFGDIHLKKNRILARLNGISLKLGFEVNPFLEDLQTELWKELEAIFIQEEILWKQCSRCKWIYYGDRNTSYFHNLATARRRRNRVTMLKNQHGDWIDDTFQLQQLGMNHFLSLYADDQPYEKLVASGLFPTWTSEEVGRLDRMVAVKEVSAAIFSMGAWKAPGPDGLPPMFYQSNWDGAL